MSNQEFASSLVMMFGVMGAVAIFEAAAPLFARPSALPGRQRANLAMTLQTMLVAFGLTWAASAAAVLVSLSSPRWIDLAGWPAPLGLVAGIVALDFAFGYVAHRTLHAFPALWRFHRVHHSDPFVDVTTSFRTHPVETAWRYLWMYATVWVLGVPAATVAAYRALSAINAILEHANVRVPVTLDMLISRMWVTPNMHKVHHSRDRAETDSNYGNLLSLHDWVLGTYIPSRRAASVRYGLEDADPAECRTFRALLSMPWRRREPRIENSAAAATTVSS